MNRVVTLAGASLVALALSLAAQSASPDQATTDRIDASSTPGPNEPSLAEVRAATERFQDVEQAIAEGYVRDPFNMCETADMIGMPASMGAMGVHYVRMDLLGVAAPPDPRVNGNGMHSDFTHPSVLVYEPHEDGSMELVAVENLVWVKAWEDAGHSEPPSFHGMPYDKMADDPSTPLDEAHNFMPHYDRHVWLYRENPNGTFKQFNPMVSCAGHMGNTEHMKAHGMHGMHGMMKN